MSFKLVKTRGTKNPSNPKVRIIEEVFDRNKKCKKIKKKLLTYSNEGNVVQTS